MDNLLSQVQNQITKSNSVLIAIAKSGNFETLASGLALFLSIKKLGKSCSIIAKSPTISDAQLLYGVDKIGKLSDKKNLVINLDNAVKNVDKVTYFLDGAKLKIIVHAFSESNGINDQDISFEKTSPKPDLILSLGYQNQEQLKNDITHEYNIDPETVIINLNNTQESQNIAQLQINQPGSYSELVTNLILDLSLPLDEDISFNLYAALASATKMFSPSDVGPHTFEIAQTLIKYGAGNANLAKKVMKNMATQPQQSQPNIQKFEIDKDNLQPKNFFEEQIPIEEVEREKTDKEAWLKPPKIYRGSKSFDIES